MATKKQEADISILDIPELEVGTADMFILGISPLIFNRMASKARQELMYPRAGRKSEAEKMSTMKHDPLQEYRDSVSRLRAHEKGPTRLVFPSPAFKGAMATASLDIPSVTKSRINRLTWVSGFASPIWGVPQMFMAVVRNSDMNRTPDIRTRAIVPQWAARIGVRFVSTLIRPKVISSLVGASGLIVGIGDFRQEKGKGSFGQFEVVSEDDPRLLKVMAEGGMKAQDKALESPDFFDQDTEDLYSWFTAERVRRDAEQPRAKRTKRSGDDLGTVAGSAD